MKDKNMRFCFVNSYYSVSSLLSWLWWFCSLATVYSQPPCSIVGFNLWLRSGYDQQWISYTGRGNPMSMYNNDLFCSTIYGDNIEAVLSSTTCNSMGGVTFSLFNRTPTNNNIYGTNIAYRYEATPQYYLYGKNTTNPDNIAGQKLSNGIYTIVAKLKNNRSITLKMDFEMVTCWKYQPKNECDQCGVQGKVCEASQCVGSSTSGIRFALITYGQGTFDIGMTIISPKNSIVRAYYPRNATTDPTTGGYVDTDYKDSSCSAGVTGVWMKNIIYPTYMAGLYSITLENILSCSFLSGPMGPPPNSNRFEIRAYRREKLVQKIAGDASSIVPGSVYTFKL